MKSTISLVCLITGLIFISDPIKAFNEDQSIVCKSSKVLNQIEITFREAPFSIAINEKNKTSILWDADHRCGLKISDEIKETTKCDFLDQSDTNFYGYSFHCYHVDYPNNHYLSGSLGINLTSGSGKLNCAHKNYKLVDCK